MTINLIQAHSDWHFQRLKVSVAMRLNTPYMILIYKCVNRYALVFKKVQFVIHTF